MAGVERAIVFGINSISMEMHTPNNSIAEYAAAHPEKIIGFMSIDPNDPGALDELERCYRQLNLRGIKMSPVYQNYHPCEEKARNIHRRAEQLGLPILTHAALHSIAKTPMEFANPLLYDSVATEFPNLKIILAHIGLPWFTDAMVIVRKHNNVFADISPARHRTWIYHALAQFQEFGVLDKLMFGTDFPVGNTEQVLANLRNINQMVENTGMPRVQPDLVEELIHRDSLRLLGLA